MKPAEPLNFLPGLLQFVAHSKAEPPLTLPFECCLKILFTLREIFAISNRYQMKDSKDKSPHILNASSNLLGLCFVVLTYLKVVGKSQTTIIDEITFVAIILFMASCLLSFLSIREENKRSLLLEQIADIIFLCGLALLFLTTILFSFNIIT